jgi:hypothetical protein
MSWHKLYSHFLIFRGVKGRNALGPTVMFEETPIGGLELLPWRVLHGVPIGDYRLAQDLAKQRFDWRPDEVPIVVEVFGRADCERARKLDQEHARAVHRFAEWMEQPAYKA